MGQAAAITFTKPLSTLGSGVFNAAVDSCALASYTYTDTVSSIITLTGFEGSIYTTDGAQVTATSNPLVIKAFTTGTGFVSLTIQVQFRPVCQYSPILNNLGALDGPLAISVNTLYSIEFVLPDT